MNDVSLSRTLEQREFEACRQRIWEGRVRAAPVLVHPGGVPGSRNILEETVRSHAPRDPTVSQDASIKMVRVEGVGNNPRAEATTRPRAPSTDSESTSSDSSTHTEMRSARPAFTLSNKLNGRPKKAKENHSDSSTGGIGQRYGEGKLPRQKVDGGHPSLQEPSQSPPQDKKQRRRRYSFEKGDDEILPMNPLTLASEFFAHSKSPAREKMAAQLGMGRFLTVTSEFGNSLNGRDTDPTATPTSDFDSDSVKHSSSTNTVKWVGNCEGDGNGCSNKGGNAEHGEIEDTG